MKPASKVAACISLLTFSGCTTIKAKAPNEFSDAARSWELRETKGGPILPTQVNTYQFGPYRSSAFVRGVSPGFAANFKWSDSEFDRKMKRERVSFEVTGGETTAQVSCEYSLSKTAYRKGSSTLSTGKQTRICDVSTNTALLELEVGKRGTEPRIKNRKSDKPLLALEITNDITGSASKTIKSGIKYIRPGKKSKAVAWLKTLGDGDPPRVVVAEKTGPEDEVLVVALSMAYLVAKDFEGD
jgi:hypothetical protein